MVEEILVPMADFDFTLRAELRIQRFREHVKRLDLDSFSTLKPSM